MELGQRLRQARLEAGLSQRQLCGSEITRNMLSQIENGSARPSMDTLRYLASRLEKPVSFFLEGEVPVSPNQQRILDARQALTEGDHLQVLTLLEDFREPDPVFDPEAALLTATALLALAENALSEDRIPYAAELLERAEPACEQALYGRPWLQRQYLLLLAQTEPANRDMLLARIPADDRELLLRAESALAAEDYARCRSLLDAAGNRSGSRWCLLRGDAAFGLEQYREAIEYYRQAEDAFPAKVLSRLEEAYLRLEDYKMAYLCACRLRELQ